MTAAPARARDAKEDMVVVNLILGKIVVRFVNERVESCHACSNWRLNVSADFGDEIQGTQFLPRFRLRFPVPTPHVLVARPEDSFDNLPERQR